MSRDQVDDLGMSMDELRVVARFAVESADDVLSVFEAAHGNDERPRAAVRAAWVFIDGEARARLQRVTSLAAHRAAREAAEEPARCAAHAAGDAAAAAYLHPPAQVTGWASKTARDTQVGHVLRPAAHAARVAELLSGGERTVGDTHIEQAFLRAPPTLIDIVRRYPPLAAGKSRVAQLMKMLDDHFRVS